MALMLPPLPPVTNWIETRSPATTASVLTRSWKVAVDPAVIVTVIPVFAPFFLTVTVVESPRVLAIALTVRF